MINTGKIWHSPLNVFWHIQELTKKVGGEAIEKDRKYQMVREARVGAVMALTMFKRMKKPTYLQLYKPDPPDVILMQPSNKIKGQLDITMVEITTYIRKPNETLLGQLKRSKLRPGIPYLSENYILAINVGIGLEVDYEPIRDYLNQNKDLFPYPIWTFQQISNYPDTIGRVVIVNPEIITMDVNVGESAFLWKESKLPDVLNTKRIANPDLVRYEPSARYTLAPWESLN